MYKVVIAQQAKRDIIEKKKYILEQFGYKEYAEEFSQSVKKAILSLKRFPTRFCVTDFQYRGYDIYLKIERKHLLFYTINNQEKVVIVLRVLSEGMNWNYIIDKWLDTTRKY